MIDYLQKFRLDGKTAYIVGGLGLIGKEVSAALAVAGAKIVILDIDEDDGETFSRNIDGFDCKVNFELFNCEYMDQIEKNFSGIISKNGCPDIFINCSYPRTADWGKSSFREVTLDSFRKNVDIHMNSYAWLARLAAEEMVNNKESGSIIQLGSTYGIVGQDLSVYEGTEMTENMTYAAIKGAVINLTRQMASYYGQYNIRVNTLCPGGLDGHVAGKSDKQNPIFVENYSKKTPLRRLGTAEEIAPTVLFLASEASSYITGSTIMVDGGWSSI
jgi:NAD(P)-dependent dehydrogenase (short-subunit alcohol dehydrogenase family)